jgi:hypothetical protein
MPDTQEETVAKIDAELKGGTGRIDAQAGRARGRTADCDNLHDTDLSRMRIAL